MATDLELLLVRVEANLKQYEKEMARARQIGVKELRAVEAEGTKAANRLEKSFAGVGSRVTSGLKGFGAGIVAGLGVEQIAKASAAAIKSIADIGDQAKKLGLSNQDFQTLQLAAQLSGVEVSALATSMKRLGQNTSDAVRGSGEFAKLLKANNVSLTDSNGKLKSQTEVLAIVADLYANAANEQDKLKIAQIAGGKSMSELAGLLEQGGQGVKAAMEESSKAGVQFTDTQIANAQRFDDNLDVLISKISVGLKSAFIDAAIGAESFANDAISALDRVGIKSEGILQSLLNSLKYNPAVLSTTLALGALQDRGQAAGSSIPLAQSGDGKGDLPRAASTVVPNAEAEAAAKKLNAELERRRRLIQGIISDLKFEGQQLKANELQQKINVELRKADVTAASEQGRAIAALVTANYNFEESQKRQKENEESNRKAAEETIAVRIQLAEEARQASVDLFNEQKEGLMQLAEIGVNSMLSVANGTLKAKDAAKQLALQIAEAVIKAQLLGQGPLAGFFGGSGKGGFFGNLIGSLFGGGGSPASIYHQGGVVGNGGPTRSVSPALFANAPRYHQGGVAGLKAGEVPAILQRGERVIPRGGSMTSSGATSITYAPVYQASNGVDEMALRRVQREGFREFEAKIPSIIAKHQRAGAI